MFCKTYTIKRGSTFTDYASRAAYYQSDLAVRNTRDNKSFRIVKKWNTITLSKYINFIGISSWTIHLIKIYNVNFNTIRFYIFKGKFWKNEPNRITSK